MSFGWKGRAGTVSDQITNTQDISPDSESTNNVLFVDDEEQVLHAIKSELLQSEFKVFLAQSGDLGLKVLEDENIDVVVSDTLMPEMNGIEFLRYVKDEFPGVHRVIISDEDDQATVNSIISRGYATSFLPKPWEKEALRKRIDNILEIRKFLKQKKLLETISEIDRLPSLPAIYQEFMEAVFLDKSAPDIAKVIDKDVSLSTRLLQIANSAFYASMSVCSVERAIVRLGLNTIRDMVLTFSLVNDMNWNAAQFRHLQNIFDHSSRVNRYLKKVYEKKYRQRLNPELASIGLMHDIGKIIILQYFPERFENTVANQRKNPGMTFYESELDLGYSWFMHEEVGAYFLHLWNLPDMIVESTLFHHRPDKSGEKIQDIIQALAFANTLVTRVEVKKNEEEIELGGLPEDFLPKEEVEGFALEIEAESKQPSVLQPM